MAAQESQPTATVVGDHAEGGVGGSAAPVLIHRVVDPWQRSAARPRVQRRPAVAGAEAGSFALLAQQAGSRGLQQLLEDAASWLSWSPGRSA